MRRLLGAGAAGGVALLVLVWWVLESSGVAVVETRPPEGGTRETHVWYVRADDGVWLEAGRPVHPWYRDLQRDPRLVIRADDLEGAFVAEIVPGEAAHDRVRALLREKYGLRDRILGWVVDTSPSIAIRLEAPPGAAGPTPGSADPTAHPADPPREPADRTAPGAPTPGSRDIDRAAGRAPPATRVVGASYAPGSAAPAARRRAPLLQPRTDPSREGDPGWPAS